jgi:hypothetical protein
VTAAAPALDGNEDTGSSFVAGLEMSNAWELWSQLARSGVMSTPEGRDHMLKRHDIVVRIIEANSRRLRLDNEINGLDIERRIAERDLQAAPDDQNVIGRLASVDAKISVLQEASNKLELTREWLDQSLAEFDGSPPPESGPRAGRA